MELLENLTTISGEEEERNCAIGTLESVLNAMTYFKRVLIDNKNCIILNDSAKADEALYFTDNYIYIPEKLVVDVFANDSYLEPYDIVTVLNNCRYLKKRILCEDFYDVLKVKTRQNIGYDIDCLTFEYNTLKEIIADLFLKNN